jgi:soluble lytic murein transglycosylase-like protein
MDRKIAKIVKICYILIMNIATLFFITTTQLSLPPGLLSSVCYVESHHDVTAMHIHDGKGNSVGICQIKIKTAQQLGFKGTEKELSLPKTNILYAGLYLKHQIDRYHSVNRGVIAYNIGSAKELTSTKYQAKVFREWRKYNEQRICSVGN